MGGRMNYLSVCSGIEAATVAWHHIGWKPVAFSEIEKFPSQVIAHHYPTVPNVGDMTKYKEWNLNGAIDLLVGGTPCQSFSVAGLRKGRDDPRGNLALTYVGILDHFKPKWFVWENVPGVLSSGGGRDFGSFLGALAEIGYGFAYRVLDAQYFGVAQRRRRVFVVGCLGDWESAAKVLFEPESLCGNIKKGRSSRQNFANSVKDSVGALCARDYKGVGNQYVQEGKILPVWPAEITPTLDASFGNKQGLDNQHINSGGVSSFEVSKCLTTKTRNDYETETFIPTNGGHFSSEIKVFECHPADSRVKEMGDVFQTVTTRWGTGGGNVPIALAENTIGIKPENGGNGDGFTEVGPMYTLNCTGVHGVAHPLVLEDQGGSVINTRQDVSVGTLRAQTHGHEPSVISNMAVRRLTPIECERLQGFPDNYTQIPWRKKEADLCPDGPRYKALGNSMAVPVMKWIGERIQMIKDAQ